MVSRPLIMVVNNDSIFLELMRELLADEGYAVEIAYEEKGAYERIRQQRPALVILDVRLEHPEAGWEIATLLRLNPDTAALPVIICSADTQFLKAKADQLRAQQCEVLEKPFVLDGLLAKVHAVLGQVCGCAATGMSNGRIASTTRDFG